MPMTMPRVGVRAERAKSAAFIIVTSSGQAVASGGRVGASVAVSGG